MPLISHPQTSTQYQSHKPSHCAATLILSCLSLCCACNTNRSTAYPNLSFFPLNCFSRNASLLPSPLIPTLCLSAAPPLPLAPPPIESRPSPIRPSSSSVRATRACSRRASLSMCVSTRERRELISGVREARRVDWAAWRVGSGRTSKC